jgi:hypothetical protein
MTPDQILEMFSKQPNGGPSVMRDSLLVVGAVGIVILAIVIWVRYVRKKPRKRKHHHHHSRSQTVPSPTHVERNGHEEESTDESRGRRKRRRRRREHRPRNPTLAETGGLPPVRPDDASPRGT